jgi:hypothetical protein
VVRRQAINILTIREDDTAEQVSRRADAEHGLETDAKVGTEIVENQVGAPRFRVEVFEQVLDEGDEVDFGSVIGHLDRPSSALGFDCHGQITIDWRRVRSYSRNRCWEVCIMSIPLQR